VALKEGFLVEAVGEVEVHPSQAWAAAAGEVEA